MNWLAMILKLLPYVVAGVNVIHSDLDTAGKVAATKDALGIATAASGQVLTGSNAQLAQVIGAEATQTVSSVVDVLHQTPAVQS